MPLQDWAVTRLARQREARSRSPRSRGSRSSRRSQSRSTSRSRSHSRSRSPERRSWGNPSARTSYSGESGSGRGSDKAPPSAKAACFQDNTPAGCHQPNCVFKMYHGTCRACGSRSHTMVDVEKCDKSKMLEAYTAIIEKGVDPIFGTRLDLQKPQRYVGVSAGERAEVALRGAPRDVKFKSAEEATGRAPSASGGHGRHQEREERQGAHRRDDRRH